MVGHTAIEFIRSKSITKIGEPVIPLRVMGSCPVRIEFLDEGDCIVWTKDDRYLAFMSYSEIANMLLAQEKKPPRVEKKIDTTEHAVAELAALTYQMEGKGNGPFSIPLFCGGFSLMDCLQTIHNFSDISNDISESQIVLGLHHQGYNVYTVDKDHDDEEDDLIITSGFPLGIKARPYLTPFIGKG